jgi:hypothetical protein
MQFVQQNPAVTISNPTNHRDSFIVSLQQVSLSKNKVKQGNGIVPP